MTIVVVLLVMHFFQFSVEVNAWRSRWYPFKYFDFPVKILHSHLPCNHWKPEHTIIAKVKNAAVKH